MEPILLKVKDVWAEEDSNNNSNSLVGLQTQTGVINNSSLALLEIDQILLKTKENCQAYKKAKIELEEDLILEMRDMLKSGKEDYLQAK